MGSLDKSWPVLSSLQFSAWDGYTTGARPNYCDEAGLSHWCQFWHWPRHGQGTCGGGSRGLGHIAQFGTHPKNAEAAFNDALTDARYFDVLINNAGAGHFDPAELVPMETITSQFQILVFGQIQLMQLALRHMQTRGEGLIINVTSLASRLPVPFM